MSSRNLLQATGHFIGAARDHMPAHGESACTYRDWLRQRLDRDIQGDLSLVRVQVMRRGVKSCAVVLDAQLGDGSQDWFRVRENGSAGANWLPSTKVRLGSGDGRCRCEKDADEAAGSLRACAEAPAASAVPPGNTGTTVVEGA